jgi:ABC-2 type transport system ATP-binding protein
VELLLRQTCPKVKPPRKNLNASDGRFAYWKDKRVSDGGEFVGRETVFSAKLPKVSMSQNSMIEVSNLTKRYAGRTAVSDISFMVAPGEIVGLLGPNGAGKSTTMRILSCFMPATSGTARVAGHDVFHESDEVRRRIGYMPENNPLYPEMRVREYLKFRARLKGLGWRRSRERVSTVMEQCGLGDVGRRVIGQLSKGYRQRVGLADALVHDPELIILDEPTIGLDPHQIRAVRQLIKGLAGKHTILISTHILPEAEMMCSRMLIMFDGKILASDTPENLQRRMTGSSRVTAEIAAPEEALRGALGALPEVEQCDISAIDGDFFRCALTPRDRKDVRPLVFALARELGWTLRELTRNRHSLEDIYVQITKPKDEEDEGG